MAVPLFFRQVWTLIVKNLLVMLVRRWASTPFRAFILPCGFVGFLAYARFLFVQPSIYGISEPHPVRSLPDVIGSVTGGRTKLFFVNNGFSGGDIENVINTVSSPLTNSQVTVSILQREDELLTECRSGIMGTTSCIAAAVFYSSPSEGEGGIWNYSLRTDGALGNKIDVESDTNDAQIYTLPFQQAIDFAIAGQNGTVDGASLPSLVQNIPYTSQTKEERAIATRTSFMGGIVSTLAVAFYLSVVLVAYQLTGLIATERELGMAQLLDSMMPNKKRWQPQAARILANHLAADIIYLPGWIMMSIILSVAVFIRTNAAITFFFYILSGMATSSVSIFAAGFFRKAQLSGITSTIVCILLAIVAQFTRQLGTGSVAILSLLFPPVNHVYFTILVAEWERKDLGTNLIKAAPESPSTVPGIAFFFFAIFHIVVYPVLGALVERALYGTASSSRTTEVSNSNTAISIRGFTKIHRPGWMTRFGSWLFRKPANEVLAVNNLTLDALRGEIMVLLGANGSGKSTTLDSVAGLLPITSGEIAINYPNRNGSLGLCPQKNVLWDDLTVTEHVRIFDALKSVDKKASYRKLDRLLKSCDIYQKAGSYTKTLSGGQKRKVQLAAMFAGGSSVCLVDEVSSGLDPLSRRKIWDILLAERGRRSIVLTTHFLDEADLLADHIAILSKGQLRAYGTSVDLKDQLGSGYRVHVYHLQNSRNAVVYNDVPHVQHDEQMVYMLSGSAETSQFLQRLEIDGIREYQVSGPTIEDVFLKLADEARSPSEDYSKFGSGSESEGLGMREKIAPAPPRLLNGRRLSMFQQAKVLFWKRFVVIRRNPLPYLAALVIPVVAAALAGTLIKDYTLPGCSPVSGLARGDISSLSSGGPIRLVAGPSSRITPESLVDFVAGLPGATNDNVSQIFDAMTIVETIEDFNGQIDTFFANVTPGGFFLGDANAPPTFAWRANGDFGRSQVIQNMFDNFLTNVTISARYQPFDVPFPPNVGSALQLVTYFGLAMSVYPAFLSLYPTIERLRNVRGLHYSNGVRAFPLWLAYTLFDFLLIMIISVFCIIILAVSTSVWYNIAYMFVIFFLFGLASTLLSYVVSLFAKSQLSAFAIAAIYQALMFLLYFIAFMSILTYVNAATQQSAINVAHFTIGILSPIANLTRAFFISLNIFSVTCHGRELASYPGDITAYGGPILYLVLQSFFLFGVIMWLESGSFFTRLFRKNKAADLETRISGHHGNTNELTRISSSRDGLRVLHLTKEFKDNLAVDDITFGVPRGEIFALLGPNGAGKSTCISLVRGDIKPSSKESEIFVEDVSVVTRRALARSKLGVCPQFDAMDTMTVAEHLYFYAMVRGVSDPRHNVQAIVQAVGLQPYTGRMAAKLSGGNKRKLSLGIAMMGNPSVLLLDEPSSGMDAASKRVMWRTLASVSDGRSIVLTTHSMEEADALANRAGIMASKMLALGTTEYLRRKHGDSYYVHIVHRMAPHTPQPQMLQIQSWVKDRFPDAEIESETYHGQLRFTVPTGHTGPGVSETTLSTLFSALEEQKTYLDIAHYSVSRATLDQVFLNIVGKHNVKEEGQ